MLIRLAIGSSAFHRKRGAIAVSVATEITLLSNC